MRSKFLTRLVKILPRSLVKIVTISVILIRDFLLFLIENFLLGLLRFGFVIENLFSTPILNGFTQGAAVLIVLSQLKHLLRITIPATALTLPGN